MSTPSVPGGSGSTGTPGSTGQTWPPTTTGEPTVTETTVTETTYTSTGAGSTGGGANDQAKEAAGTAAEQGKHVAGTAADEAKNVGQEAKAQASNLLGEAKSQVDEQARSQRDRLVSTLRTFGDDIEKMANGEQTGGGMAQDLARQVADRAREFSSRMDGREPTELLDEVRAFARRRPGAFLFGALAAGVVAGRVTRGAKQANQGPSYDSQVTGAGGTLPTSGQGFTETSYTEVTGTAAGAPTAGVGTPQTPPAYPAGSAMDEPGTTLDQPLGGSGVTGTTGTTPTSDNPWSSEGNRGGTV